MLAVVRLAYPLMDPYLVVGPSKLEIFGNWGQYGEYRELPGKTGRYGEPYR